LASGKHFSTLATFAAESIAPTHWQRFSLEK